MHNIYLTEPIVIQVIHKSNYLQAILHFSYKHI